MTDRRLILERVERSLRGAALWDEVKDRVHESALGLSSGQQQSSASLGRRGAGAARRTVYPRSVRRRA
jgi:ABC-type phosphate transport system ATPase subunit